ncbi:BON domain-containing protein [Yanghanlia caeni]|uniref:BON domain-containing protein n=1 Tax=Yanghanlia caeni TaxID=3064283 RepID=A0ABU1D7X9_9BURK|nr:BON domain-containing protein [Alcaligenaceae bacterium LG-2]HZH56160.1 BON domain-containing protein [Burkholderiaceae bacterium]
MPCTRPSRLLRAACALTVLAALSGCGALVVGGTAATTAVVATDRRTAGEQLEDTSIEMKVGAEMRRIFAETPAVRIVPHSYAGQVLLVGDVPSEKDKQQAGEAAQKVDKVVRVVNELRVGPVTPTSVRTNDTWITSKVKAALINTKEVPSRTISVTTERGIVYLQGRVTHTEGERAGIVASGVSGVNKVVKLFEIVSPESVQQPAAGSSQPAPIEQPASQSDSSGAPADTGGAQAMPVQ